jgi:hypothetical protein
MFLENEHRVLLKEKTMRKNITVSINGKVYQEVHVWCARRDTGSPRPRPWGGGTSVSAVVQRFLEDLPRLRESRRFPLPDARYPKSFRHSRTLLARTSHSAPDPAYCF